MQYRANGRGGLILVRFSRKTGKQLGLVSHCTKVNILGKKEIARGLCENGQTVKAFNHRGKVVFWVYKN